MSRSWAQKQRLLKLADFLENQVKDERFNLDVIATTESCKIPSQTACGTAACAIGHMPQVFPRACRYSEIDESCLEDNTINSDNPWQLDIEGKREFSGLSDFKLAKEFFGLNEVEAQYLFMPDEYGPRRGRKTVAHRIRKFVEIGHIPKDHPAYDRAVDEGYYDVEDTEENESDELVSSGFGC